MPKIRLVTLLLLVIGASQIHGQYNFPQFQGQRVDADTALSRALKASSLTEEGKPFHAVLAINGEPPFTGRVEVWWEAKQKYKVVITSPTFSQTQIVNDAKVMETDTGDYHPRWLENFVDGRRGISSSARHVGQRI